MSRFGLCTTDPDGIQPVDLGVRRLISDNNISKGLRKDPKIYNKSESYLVRFIKHNKLGSKFFQKVSKEHWLASFF